MARHPSVERTCERCGVCFREKAARVKMGKGKFCSWACYRPSEKSPVEVQCETCGKAFLVHQARLAIGQGRFCTGRCWGKSRKGRDVAERLNERLVQRGKCLEWTGGLSSGYGAIRIGPRSIGAHRVAWELKNGPIPDGLDVLHHCDNRRCCLADPDPAVSHLYLGTDLENVRDCVVRGRKHSPRKLSLADQVAVLRRLEEGPSQRTVAKEFGVHPATISRIKNGRPRTLKPGSLLAQH